MPKVVGSTLIAAVQRLGSANCAVGSIRRAYSRIPKGRVAKQNPAAGTHIAAGARVDLVMSRGAAPRKHH